jgi:hypothetical protein
MLRDMDRGQTGSASTQQGGYPRPQFRRAEWTSLDGTWDFALDRDTEWLLPDEVSWGSRIVVPFAPETARGGVRDTGFYSACWYRRTIPVPPLAPRERLMLHFGAVDHAATVWANGERCSTQFADTYQEANGLLHAERTPKFQLEQIATATRGARRFSDLSMPPAPPPAQLRIPGSASDPGRSARDRRGEGR